MVIDFSRINTDEMPTLILRNMDGTPIQSLGYAFNIEIELMYNETSTLTFDIPAEVGGKLTPHYNDIVGMRIIDMVGYGQFVLVDPEEESDGIKRIKSCKAYSLEYEFTKKNITMVNDTYKFWDMVYPNDTVLGRILEKMSDWKLGTVDDSLIDKYRTFEVSEENIYNFIKSTVQKTFGCIFDFDTYNRTINIVSVESAVETKPIYLSDERLIKNIQIDEDSDNIVTCLDVNGADGVDIRSINPTGTNKIYNLDYFMNETNFSKQLIDKWNNWQKLCETNQETYNLLNVERNLKTTQLITEQVALVDLQNELKGYESVQSVIIQSGSSDSETQERLAEVKRNISDKSNEISAKETLIKELQSDKEDIQNKIDSIITTLSMKDYFTSDELSKLNKYFIEGSLEDETFVAASTSSYTNTNISSHPDNEIFKVIGYSSEDGAEVSSPVITKITTNGTKTIYSIEGGQVQISDISAVIVRANVEFNNDNTFVFTGYLNKGLVNTEDFEVANLSAIGDYGNLKTTNNAIEFTVNNCTLYFTHDVTDYEKHSIEYDLYEYGKQVLAEKSSPTYTFTIDSGNFLYLDDFVSFKNALTLGKRLYLRLDKSEDVITPFLVGVEWKFEDPASFKLTFGNTYTAFDKTFELSKLLEDSVSMGRSLNTKSGVYSEFVSSGASSSVREFMNSALDVAKNAVLSSGNQDITFDDTGIRLRKWKDAQSTYEDEQIWMTDNVIAFTDDNWSSVKMAIGKIIDPNIPEFSDGKGYAYGIAAPYLVGTILAGQNLVITTENGSFKVDSNGVMLDSLNLNIISGKTDGTGLTFNADEGLKHIVKSNSKTYEAGFCADNNNNAGYGLYFKVGDDKKLYFDVDKGELVVDGSIWAKEIFLGSNKKNIIEYCADCDDEDSDDKPQYKISGDFIEGRGLKAYDNSGNVRVKIDGADGSLNVYDGYIYLTNGKNSININPDKGLVFTSNGAEKLKLDITTGNVTLGDGAILTAPEINGGTITGGIFRATGQGRNNDEAAYYIQNGNVLCGYISYDSNGAGTVEEAKERVFLTTVNGTALKIQSEGNMSLEAGSGKSIYFASSVNFIGSNLKWNGETLVTKGDLEDIKSEISDIKTRLSQLGV